MAIKKNIYFFLSVCKSRTRQPEVFMHLHFILTEYQTLLAEVLQLNCWMFKQKLKSQEQKVGIFSDIF